MVLVLAKVRHPFSFLTNHAVVDTAEVCQEHIGSLQLGVQEIRWAAG
jgi:hypothetical protein